MCIFNSQEGMLNKLQTHVEHEERNWRHTLAEKDTEIEVLTEQYKLQVCKRYNAVLISVQNTNITVGF